MKYRIEIEKYDFGDRAKWHYAVYERISNGKKHDDFLMTRGNFNHQRDISEEEVFDDCRSAFQQYLDSRELPDQAKRREELKKPL